MAFLLQIVFHGIQEVVTLLKRKFNCIGFRNIAPVERKCTGGNDVELNEKPSQLDNVVYCAQDNFHRQMFYDGTHLNRQGTVQLVSNYKYWIDKSERNTSHIGWKGIRGTPRFKQGRTKDTANEQSNLYADKVRGNQHFAVRLADRRWNETENDTFYSLAKLLMDIMNSS